MRSEALDIIIESRTHAVWLFLAGPFNNEQVPNIREKLMGLVDDGNRLLVIDLEQITEMGDAVVPLFLSVASAIKGKGGDVKFIFRNEIVSQAFQSVRNIIPVFPNAEAVKRAGFLNKLRYRRRLMSRRTGLRLSRPIAIFVVAVLCGWFLSLALIIRIQSVRIKEQELELHDLTQWRQQSSIELQRLQERLRPLQQLGLIPDSLTRSAP